LLSEEGLIRPLAGAVLEAGIESSLLGHSGSDKNSLFGAVSILRRQLRVKGV
jgi:hypothetical protein